MGMIKEDQTRVSRPKKRDNRWNLILVGEDGKIINVPRIKGLIIFLSVISVVLAIGVAGLLFVFLKGEKKSAGAEKELAALNRKVLSLQDENHLLTADLVIARAKLEKAMRQNEGLLPEKSKAVIKKQAETKKTETKKKASTPDNKPKASDNGSKKKQEKAATKAPVKKTGKKTALQKPLESRKRSVSISEFTASNDPEKGLITVGFMLRNPHPDSGNLTGRMVVVLRSEKNADGNHLSIPPATLVSGKPAHEAGRAFKISRFKRIVLKSRNNKLPYAYDQAVLYIFDTAGSPLFEKNYPVSIQKKSGDKS